MAGSAERDLTLRHFTLTSPLLDLGEKLASAATDGHVGIPRSPTSIHNFQEPCQAD